MLYVQIIEKDTGHCIKQLPASSQRRAEQIQNGVEINLYHKAFKVQISETPMDEHKP